MVESREICHENLVPHTHVQSSPSHQIQSRKKCSNVVHLTPLLICWVPVIVHGSCISVYLYFCTSASLYVCIFVFRAWHYCWCVDLFADFLYEGRRLGWVVVMAGKADPWADVDFDEVQEATCLEAIPFSTIFVLLFNYLLPKQECKRHVKLLRGCDYFFGQSSHAQCALLFTFLNDSRFQ